MTPRQRVIQALKHQETDYVPYQFHAVSDVWEKVVKHYQLPAGTALLEEFFNNHIIKIGSDFNVNIWADNVGAELVSSGGPQVTALDAEGGLHTDEFGCVWDRHGGMPHPVSYPLADDHSQFDGYQMPDPRRKGRFDQARLLADRHRDQRFVIGKLGMFLFERAWSIRGMEQLLTDMMVRPEWVEELMDRILYEWNLPIIDQQLDIGVDGFYFGDDWASKLNLLFDPDSWRRFIKPRLAVCYRRVKERGGFVGQHSCGNISEIIPDLIELGLDFYNPFQPAVYDVGEMKNRYGDRLSFYGGVDLEGIVSHGTPEQVREEVLAKAELLGKGGGYILQTSHTILDDAPLENVIAYVEACHELAGIDTQAAAERIRNQPLTDSYD
jgi:uroporphyrinogen decarboxylase